MATTNLAEYAHMAPDVPAPLSSPMFFRASSQADFTAVNDVLRVFNNLPAGHVVHAATVWVESQFDTNASSTHTFSLRVTDGTTNKVLITDSDIGQNAPSSRIDEPGTVGELANLGSDFIDDGDWRVELICTAVSATAANGTIAGIIWFGPITPSSSKQTYAV